MVVKVFAFALWALASERVEALQLRADGGESDVAADFSWEGIGDVAPSASASRWCVHDKLYPAFYILGAQKAATSTMACDVHRKGVLSVSAVGKKEFHFWEKTVGNTEDLAAAFHEALPSCKAGKVGHLVADYTPSNLRLVPLPNGNHPTGSSWGLWNQHHENPEEVPGDTMNLPKILSEIYGELAGDVTYVVMLREPLSRMQSAWYHAKNQSLGGGIKNRNTGWLACGDCKSPSFAKALDATLTLAKDNVIHDWLWASMYSRQIRAWLQHVNPSQLYVAPMKYYLGDMRAQVCEELSEMLKFHLWGGCANIAKTIAPLMNSHDHPALDDDVSVELKHLFEAYIQAEVDDLVLLLLDAYKHGVKLAAFEGAANRESVEKWLKAGW